MKKSIFGSLFILAILSTASPVQAYPTNNYFPINSGSLSSSDIINMFADLQRQIDNLNQKINSLSSSKSISNNTKNGDVKNITQTKSTEGIELVSKISGNVHRKFTLATFKITPKYGDVRAENININFSFNNLNFQPTFKVDIDGADDDVIKKGKSALVQLNVTNFPSAGNYDYSIKGLKINTNVSGKIRTQKSDEIITGSISVF